MSKVPGEPAPASPGQDRLARDGIIYTLGTAAPALATLVVLPVLTRSLSKADYGTVSEALAVVQVGVILVALGLGAAITREYILSSAGAAGARGLVLGSSVIIVALSAIALVTGSLWSPVLLGRDFDSTFAMATVCCAGGALVIVAQSYLRGAGRPVMFVLLALGGTIVGPAVGVVLVRLVADTPAMYVTCLAGGYLVAGIAGVLVVALEGRPTLRLRNMRTALRIGVPTVPHQIALYLAVSGLVIVAARVLDDSARANIVLTLGASATVITGAFNNAWAPVIYRAAPEARRSLLSTTSRQVYSIVVVLVVGLVAVTPYALAIVAPPKYHPADLVLPVAVTALAALPSVIYLASGHLIFVAGRTVPLSVSTPISVAVGLGLAVVLGERWGLLSIAVAYLTIYLLLAVLTTVVQRAVSATPWRPVVPLVPTALCLAGVGVLLVLPSAGLWIVARGLIAVTAVGLGWRAISRSRQVVAAPAAGTTPVAGSDVADG